MELSGIKFLLIYLSPVAVFAVLMFFLILLLSPLINRQFDSNKPIEKELKEKLRADRELIEEGIQKGNISCEEIATHLKEERRLIREGLRRIWRARREESGWNDFMKASRIDTNVSTTFLFVGSMLFTPMAISIAFIGISVLSKLILQSVGITEPSAFSTAGYFLLLILPAVGFWLANKAYKGSNNRLALMLCLLINIIYAVFIIYGVFRLGG
jgi:uncharacterized membrane protein